MKYVLVTFSILLFTKCIDGPQSKNPADNDLIGKTIKLMPHAVQLFVTDSNYAEVNFEAPMKLVTYGDLYCQPCWEKIPLWKNYIDEFRKYDHISFLCYVQASMEDFKKKNQEINLNFPVLLDVKGRFKAVNQIGKQPKYNTFLLNDKNEIIMFGDPSDPETRKKYLSLMEEYK